jgi:hypothetical protein
MEGKKVKELMLSLEGYPRVREDATLLEAINALELAQLNLPPGRQPHRAILVLDKQGKVVGKLGHLCFLRALEPKYADLGNISVLSHTGVSSEFIQSMMESMRFWHGDMEDLCRRGRFVLAKDAMLPVSESIDEDAGICEAAHQFVMLQTLSILVRRGENVVGILRLSDLFEEVADIIVHSGREE